jgi:hypothetical protein
VETAEALENLLRAMFDTVTVHLAPARKDDPNQRIRLRVRFVSLHPDQQEEVLKLLRTLTIQGKKVERAIGLPREKRREGYLFTLLIELVPQVQHLAERLGSFGHTPQERDPAYPIED